MPWKTLPPLRQVSNKDTYILVFDGVIPFVIILKGDIREGPRMVLSLVTSEE